MNPKSVSATRPTNQSATVDLSSATEIFATYLLSCASDEVEDLSRDLAYEQTVEVAPHLVTSRTILNDIVGQVDSIEPDSTRHAFRVTIRYRPALTARQLPQLLNLLYGNVSMKSRTRLVDLHLPQELLGAFPGPRYGIDGLRELLGVHGRPLLATALKPRGSSATDLALLAQQFALGGGDLVKDDHNLVDDTFEEFQRRVTECQQGVQQATERTGRPCLYLPNLMLPTEQMEPAVEWLLKLGVRGVLVSPFVNGLDVIRALAQKYPLFVMAHPTFSGALFHDETHGIHPGIVLGTLFRMLGADSVIFPNAGGRFTFTAGECGEISQRAREPLGHLKPSFPTPAGGMTLDNIPEMAEQFGADAIYLIGSALLSHSGHAGPSGLAESTRHFLDRIEEHFSVRHTPPMFDLVSACELPSTGEAPNVPAPLRHFPFEQHFRWEGRSATPYKPSGNETFRDVIRQELIGKSGEQTAFDLRYFEIASQGYTSREKHLHTHTIIGVRGEGVLQCGDRQIPIRPMDIAYVPPLQVHQLTNSSQEPFGFFCIVDHDRDRPMCE